MEMAAALPSSWEELSPDLLGLVLHRLPSLADRVRLRAVCRPWRAGAAARRHLLLPAPLPWLALLLDGTLVDFHGAPVRCAPILREGVFRYLAVDNLAFLVHDDGRCSLVNPLSGLTLHLPKFVPDVRRALQNLPNPQSFVPRTHSKVIVSSPLGLMPDPLVASKVRDGRSLDFSPCKDHDAISVRLRRETRIMRISDIAFVHGELYAVNFYEGLHVLKLDASHLGKPKSPSGFQLRIAEDREQQQIYNYGDDPSYYVLRYLAESNGRLLMVRRWMSIPQKAQLGYHEKTVQFEVFEADLTSTPGKWTKVDNLGGQALFIGTQCTKSLLASQCAGGVQEDSIYFMHRACDKPFSEYSGLCVDPLGDSGVYNMRDGKITPFLPEPVMAELQRKQKSLTWFFPTDA
ncbi:unnamed protein product [Urochloa decumbens]